MDTRQSKLLEAIIDQFIRTGEPVGSKNLLKVSDFCLSCATIRNEMRALGDEGFLVQPHISAGRVPTAKGYRVFVKQFMDPTRQERTVRKKFDSLKEQYFQRKDQERTYEAVSLLSQMIPDVAFATVPHKPSVYFLGLAHILRRPEFQENPLLASRVVEVLEEKLTEVLAQLEVDEQVRYYIGEENIFPQFQSCSVMLTGYKVRDFQGVVGVLGHLRMDYAYNTVALEMVADLLRQS